MAPVLSFGPYETVSRIAAGGMGEVFVARRHGTSAFEKKVALKVLLPHLAHDREFVERFFDEARLVARMNHPNIVQIFDVGETDGRPWLAMALVEAVSLSRLQLEAAAAKEQLPLPVVRLLATGLLEGLAYAHALKGPKGEPLGVVHRDITPSNLLVSSDGAVLLTDFGIAKATLNMHRTQPGRLRGKLAYLAPEMLTAEPVDQRADLFSAGVTLYQLLTGVSPFLKPSDTETMDAVKRAQPPRVESLRPDVGPLMAAALHRALSRAAADRFASAREMREALSDGPVASAPELGELVRRLCAKQLGAFVETPSLTPSSIEGGTSSLPAPRTVSQPVPERGSRAWLWRSVALVTVLGVAAGGWRWSRPAAPAVVEVEAEAPVLAAPEEAAPTPELEPLPPVVAPVAPRPTARPVKTRPAGTSRPTHPPLIEPVRVGFLTADAAPWAEVFLDGHALDRTPLSRFPVPSGSHTVTFKSSDGRKIERPVRIEEGQVAVVRVEFAADK
ncbi:MAG: protein kinase [Archangiaceae bacterium]|nr:protein kinase [Archangiaceae bacterium]